METRKSNPAALLPIVVFLVFYLGSGIYFEYINPPEGGMGFYIMSVVVAFSIALVVAFLQNRSLSFEEKIHVAAQGIGDDNITIMIFIFLMAGAFSGLAQGAGGASSTANLLLDIIPGTFAIPGLFLIACLISMAMGTSCGTISVLTPIAAAVAEGAGLSLPMCVGTVVGGAMFGDNLSFISFRTNLRIALPAAVITLAVLIVYAVTHPAVELEHFEYNLLLAVPYFIVLALSILGINVFVVLGIGILLFLGAGLFAGTISIADAFSAMGGGTSGMFETIIVTILVASIAALMREHGGFEAILEFIRNHFNSKKGGMFGIGLLTALMDIATANNTVAIVIAAPIAKNISEEYHVEPRKVASLLDTCSCIMQGIIPYGAQLLIASGIAGISSVSIIPYLYYPYLLLVCVILSILAEK